MAADINNTALQGASFIGGVAVGGRWGEHKQARGWMGGGGYQGKISPVEL